MAYWQLMNGDTSRDYSDICFNFGVACVGPGWQGNFIEFKNDYYPEDLPKVEPFTRMQENDLIILKNGQFTILGVGKIEKYNNSIYNYSNVFEDIDGWDLQHFVKVKWKKIKFDFDERLLTRTTTSAINHPDVIKKIDEIWSDNCITFIEPIYEIKELQNANFEYSMLSEHLFNAGYKIELAEDISNTIRRIELLGKWYKSQTNWNEISEHENRTHLVVPFLISLGYSPQQIAIEKNHIDILVYENSKRNKIRFLVETKRFNTGTLYALKQAIEYTTSLQELNDLVLTDGLRYSLYSKVNNIWDLKAYMNFENKKCKYNHIPTKLGMIDYILNLIK